VGSIAEPGCGASFRFHGFLLAIFGWRAGFERMNETRGNGGDIVDGRQECGFICERGLGKAADFSDELERSSANLLRSEGGSKLKSGLMFLHICFAPLGDR
jgi:hypothetical protein